MQRVKNIKRTDLEKDYINNEIDYSIVLTEEDIEAIKESEKQIERGEVYELREEMTLLDLLNEWRENNKE